MLSLPSVKVSRKVGTSQKPRDEPRCDTSVRSYTFRVFATPSRRDFKPAKLYCRLPLPCQVRIVTVLSYFADLGICY
jgi:hypothetical protein